MKNLKIWALAACCAIATLSGCGKGSTPDPEKTLTDILAGSWSAAKVSEGGTEVYDRTKTTNAQDGYRNFRLVLNTTGSTATLTERDGNTFAGTYTLTATGNTGTLVLNALNPAPTGTGGSISYSISKTSDTAITLQRSGASQKTGTSNNTYNLTK
jgi:hypothetical protein